MKKEAQPSHCEENLLGSPEKGLDQDTWGFPEARDPRDMQKEVSWD